MNAPVTRAAIGYMNYSGDQRHAIEEQIASGVPMGPNYLGEHMWPVDVVYDAETDVSHVGFSLIPPPAVAAEMAAQAERQIQLLRAAGR